MNFLFVDQILASTPAKQIVGVKHVTVDDVYVEENKQGDFALMSCIVGEALGQLAAWNVIEHFNFERRPVAGVVGEVEVLGEALVGDSIMLNSIIDSVDEHAIHYHSVATVAGEPILKLHNALGPFLPLEQFNLRSEVELQYQSINRPVDISELPEMTINPSHAKPSPHSIHFDNIVSWEKGKQAVAVKKVNGLAPYFVDHFPRKPVLPLSILLQCQVNLARDFANDLLGNAHGFKPAKIRRIKMKEFVQPGNSLFANMTLKEQSDEHLVFRFQCELNQKRVCVSEIEFTK